MRNKARNLGRTSSPEASTHFAGPPIALEQEGLCNLVKIEAIINNDV